MRLASETRAEEGRPEFPSSRAWFGVLLGYFALQVLIRTRLSGSADLDESDQLVLTQKLSWGYGPQPPLYTWIQMAFFGLFGVSIFALSLCKNLLLLCTYLLTYVNAGRITRSTLCGTAAALSLFFIPQVAWESQRDLTHSVLSATLAAATLSCFLLAHERRQTRWYLLFGLCAGMGLQSKYNYVFWLLGLLLASLSMPELRVTIRDRRMGLALGLCLLLFLPNGVWILHHRELAFLTASKFGLHESSRWLDTVGMGASKLLVAVASFIGPLVLVYLLVFLPKRLEIPSAPSSPQTAPLQPALAPNCGIYRRLLWRTLLFVAVVLAMLVLGFQATDLRERWLQPILICAPVLAVASVRERLDGAQFRILATVAVLVMAAVLLIMPGRILFAERLRREEPLNHPYDRLARQMEAAIRDSSLVVTDTRLLAGNLRLTFPDRLFVSPELVDLFAPEPERRARLLLVWDATQRTEPPKPLRQWAESATLHSLPWSQAAYFTETYQYHQKRQRRITALPLQTP